MIYDYVCDRCGFSCEGSGEPSKAGCPNCDVGVPSKLPDELLARAANFAHHTNSLEGKVGSPSWCKTVKKGLEMNNIATEIWLGPNRITPSKFKLLARMVPEGVKCFKLEYAPTISSDHEYKVGESYVLKVHYKDGREEMFRDCTIMEFEDQALGRWNRGLILRCCDEISLKDTNSLKLPWEKISDPKHPDLFVIQDWKMDLTKCQIDIKTARNRPGNNSLALILFKIEETENNEFGEISGQPILYFEYPEGKYTFESIKITQLETQKIGSRKMVPYEFQAKLIKEEKR